MDIIRCSIRPFFRWEYAWLCIYIVVTLACHFAVITQPDDVMFDEVYYVGDARKVIQGESELRGEQPPLGELLVLSGMKIFGDKPFGWRFFSVIFGTFSILFFFLICRRLGFSRTTSNLATFLFAFENQTFVQAGVTMLDVYSLTFVLASFWLYLRHSYPLTGLMLALATLSKLSGALALPPLALHWLIYRRDNPPLFLASLCAAPLLFVLLIPGLDYFFIDKLQNPLDRVWRLLTSTKSVTFEYANHPASSRPWQWLTAPRELIYWLEPHYTSLVSYTIWGATIPAMLYALYRAVRRARRFAFPLLWFAGTFGLWIPLTLATDRVTYPYYFYPSVGAVCIIVGYVLARLFACYRGNAPRWRRFTAGGLASIYLVCHLLIFLLAAPVTNWLSFP